MLPSPDASVRAYIGLGGNLERPVDHIRSARDAIAALPQVREAAFSSLYRSAPMGPADQPDYVNAVMAVDTTLEPLALLDQLQGIEAAHGRVRLGERWGPRTLDLDILAFGDQEIRTTRLQVPHPGMAEREFVLYPLMEIAPDLALPAVGLLKNLVDACPRRGLRVMADE
jgi:2-amino-4-hydroxy-6-hydroxymethyldihydropteridine diphosphokinase